MQHVCGAARGRTEVQNAVARPDPRTAERLRSKGGDGDPNEYLGDDIEQFHDSDYWVAAASREGVQPEGPTDESSTAGCKGCGLQYGIVGTQWRICVCVCVCHAMVCLACAEGGCPACGARLGGTERVGDLQSNIIEHSFENCRHGVGEDNDWAGGGAVWQSIPLSPEAALERRDALMQQRRMKQTADRQRLGVEAKRMYKEGRRPARRRGKHGMLQFVTGNVTQGSSLQEELEFGSAFKGAYGFVQEHKARGEARDRLADW